MTAAAAVTVTVSRSGGLYLIRSGPVGCLVAPDRGWQGGCMPLQSLLAHCNAQEPWEDLPPGAALPPPVAAVAAAWRAQVPEPLMPVPPPINLKGRNPGA